MPSERPGGQDWAPLSRAVFWAGVTAGRSRISPRVRSAAGWCSRSVSLPSLTCSICYQWSLFPTDVLFYSAKPKLRKATTPPCNCLTAGAGALRGAFTNPRQNLGTHQAISKFTPTTSAFPCKHLGFSVPSSWGGNGVKIFLRFPFLLVLLHRPALAASWLRLCQSVGEFKK